MFPIGSAEPQRQVVRAMDAIARILKDRPGVIVVRGHTDAHPYRSATYDNWRLSSARAQMAYYMLTRAGLPESRFERIEGYADRRLEGSEPSLRRRKSTHRNPAAGLETMNARPPRQSARHSDAGDRRLGAGERAIDFGDGAPTCRALQAQIASGDKSAYAAQPERLKAIGAAIAAAKPEVWRSKHETDAAVIYLLSGGQPRDIVQLLQSGAVPKSEMPFMRGAVAYVLGDADRRARSFWAASILASSISGSPVRSPSRNRFSTPRAMGRRRSRYSISRVCWPPAVWSRKLLCDARSCSSATERDGDRFVSLARQYATRFARSVYADGFLRGMAAAVLKAGHDRGSAELSKVSQSSFPRWLPTSGAASC